MERESIEVAVLELVSDLIDEELEDKMVALCFFARLTGLISRASVRISFQVPLTDLFHPH